LNQCVNCTALLPSGTDPRNRFCTKSCSATFNNAKRKGTKYAAYDAKRNQKESEYLSAAALCKVCSKTLPYVLRRRKTCSKECYAIWIAEHTNELKKTPKPNSGGFREGSGRGKSGWYKGIYCSSTYELAFVAYCMAHGVQIKRNFDFWVYTNPESRRESKFYPDFITEEGLVEIKGYSSQVTDAKINAVKESGNTIKVLYKANLGFAFEYVEKAHGLNISQMPALYEQSKHKHHHTCGFCGEDYTKASTKSTFCSRTCAGKSRKGCR